MKLCLKHAIKGGECSHSNKPRELPNNTKHKTEKLLGTNWQECQRCETTNLECSDALELEKIVICRVLAKEARPT